MFCGNCGTMIIDGADRCPNCGMPVGVPNLPVQETTDAKGRPLRSGGIAVAALICSVLSAMTCFFPFVSLPLALAGLICGTLGRRSKERSMAGVALAISIVFLILNAAVIIIALIYMSRYGFDLNHIQYFVEQFFKNFFR